MRGGVTFERNPRLLGLQARLFRYAPEAFVFVLRSRSSMRLKVVDCTGKAFCRDLIFLEEAVLFRARGASLMERSCRHLNYFPRHLSSPESEVIPGCCRSDMPRIGPPTRDTTAWFPIP